MPWPLVGGLVKIGGHILKKNAGGIMRAVTGKSGAAKKAAQAAGKIAAGGAAFEVGSQAAKATGRAMGFGGDDRPRRRRVNVVNVRALRRAMSREQGFTKLAKQTISFTKSTKMKTKGRRR